MNGIPEEVLWRTIQDLIKCVEYYLGKTNELEKENQKLREELE